MKFLLSSEPLSGNFLQFFLRDDSGNCGHGAITAQKFSQSRWVYQIRDDTPWSLGPPRRVGPPKKVW